MGKCGPRGCAHHELGLDQSKFAVDPAPLLIFSISSSFSVQHGWAAPVLLTSTQTGPASAREHPMARVRGSGGGENDPHGDILTFLTLPMCAQKAARAAALCSLVKSSTGPMRSSDVTTASPWSPLCRYSDIRGGG